MVVIRSVLAALVAVSSSSAALAADDVCVAWIHEFEEVKPEKPTLYLIVEKRCLSYGATLDDGFPEVPEAPHLGGGPEWGFEEECSALEDEIARMERELRQAEASLPGAEEALAEAARDEEEWQRNYELAREAWLDAVDEVDDAKAAYEQVYEIEVEVERDREGRVVVVRRQGYDADTELGRAVHEAIQREADARRAMEEAWQAWVASGSGDAARVAQARVDRYRTILGTHPAAIELARATAAALGCP